MTLTLAEHEYLLPSRLYITPSNINPWRGVRRPNDRFTLGQYQTMALYGLDPATCEVIVLRSPVTIREMWWPTGSENPVYVFPCPIIRKEKGRLLVLSPAGMKKWVGADGSLRPPRLTKRIAA